MFEGPPSGVKRKFKGFSCFLHLIFFQGRGLLHLRGVRHFLMLEDERGFFTPPSPWAHLCHIPGRRWINLKNTIEWFSNVTSIWVAMCHHYVLPTPTTFLRPIVNNHQRTVVSKYFIHFYFKMQILKSVGLCITCWYIALIWRAMATWCSCHF